MLMNRWFSIATDSRFVISRARPATTPSEASVTRNDGSRRSVTKRPLTTPTPRPTPRPAAIASTAEWLCITSAVTSAERATTEPSERSISPALSTKTTATAITLTGVVCRTMLSKFVWLRKPSSRSVTAKKTKISTKREVDDVAARFGRAERLQLPGGFRTGQATYLPRACITLAGGFRWSDSW